MTLTHLLMATAAAFPALLGATYVMARTAHLSAPLRLLAAAAALLSAVLFALAMLWLICRTLRMPPLFLFACPCPHCGRKPGAYALRTDEWPMTPLACTLCGGALVLWMTRRAAPEHLPLDTPVYCLRWPEFVGRWRRIS